MRTRREILTDFGKGVLALGAGAVGGALAQPGRLEATGPADGLSAVEVAALHAVAADWIARHPGTGGEVGAARLVRREDLKTTQQVYDAIHRPIPEGMANMIDLHVEEINPEFNGKGVQVGWRVSRERDQKKGNIFYGFEVNIPLAWGMQYGYLHDPAQRKAMGLTLDEARSLGFNDSAEGAGVPCDMDLAADGLTIFFDLSSDYSKLALQTANDRINRK